MEIKENNLKELIEKYMSIEETEENHEELHQLGHEIDHVIFDNNFYLVTHNDGEEKAASAPAVDHLSEGMELSVS